ncbi:hypothetical protein [Bogoriella caseilytica]|uniref:Putative ribosomally synthesized peptide with SipW-like signal peptide n=1 Tax=Bogoriella caseilytica TaxID=56055 RepID=A0A3N2BF10_9MICO|nr:hypothetical protein [Bogoriella caseilytica]ROR73853.1 putative ribosomally synthesized peptide with SipW-like signal peptide [Bogoriella caseilytica]
MDTAPVAPRKQRPAARPALAALGVIGLAGAATLTAANWTDTAEITGEITTGSFSLELDLDDLGFDEFVPGESQGETLSVQNNSSTPAEISLDISGLDSDVEWELTVTESGGGGISVDPSDSAEQFTGLALGPGGEPLIYDAGETGSVEISLTLVTASNESQDLDELDDLVLTFTGEQAASDGD